LKNEINEQNAVYCIKDVDMKILYMKCFIGVGGAVLVGAALSAVGENVFPSMILPMMALKIVLDSWIRMIRKRQQAEESRAEEKLQA
jgi:hypothetical protein